MAAFSPFSVNTLRINIMLIKTGEPILHRASMRSGVGQSLLNNRSAGEVMVGPDYEKRVMTKYAYEKYRRRYFASTTSGFIFERRGNP
jgi:hypothetical protein